MILLYKASESGAIDISAILKSQKFSAEAHLDHLRWVVTFHIWNFWENSFTACDRYSPKSPPDCSTQAPSNSENTTAGVHVSHSRRVLILLIRKYSLFQQVDHHYHSSSLQTMTESKHVTTRFPDPDDMRAPPGEHHHHLCNSPTPADDDRNSHHLRPKPPSPSFHMPGTTNITMPATHTIIIATTLVPAVPHDHHHPYTWMSLLSLQLKFMCTKIQRLGQIQWVRKEFIYNSFKALWTTYWKLWLYLNYFF